MIQIPSLLALFIGLALLLVLILKLKLPAFLSLLISTISIGLLLGLDAEALYKIIEKGMGGTLGYVATVVGLGAIFGALLEETGSAEAISNDLIRRFGIKNASWTMLLSGFIIAIPVFFDVAFIILVPLLYSLQQRTNKSLLYFALPLLAGLAVTHAFIPPTPGPIAVSSILGADLGLVILMGFLVGLPAAVVSGIVYGRYIAQKIHVSVEAVGAEAPKRYYPSILKILLIVLLPIVLLVLAALSKLDSWTAPASLTGVIQFVGHPFSALILANIAAWIFLGLSEGHTKHSLLKVTTKAMEPAGTIILLTGAGGVLKQLLIDSSIGLEIAEGFTQLNLSIYIIAFGVAALVRVLQGSSTVAMITAASIIAPMTPDGYSAISLALMVVAIASGASIFSHVNDSGFWLVSQYLKLNEKQTYRSWTLMTAILGFTGLFVVLLLSLLLP